MGKSGGRKKKASSNQSQNHAPSGDNYAPAAAAAAVVNGAVDLDSSSIFLKRAHELKEVGNKRFAAKDFSGALREYDAALKLIPKTHPERAVFHSNRAACLMQLKPIDYATVIAECSLALQVQPGYVRALLRRARALEAVGKHTLAMQDVQVLLSADPNHRDALEIAGRLRSVIVGSHHDAQQDLQSRPSPAALGASAVRGAPVAGLGPCLPARPTASKKAPHLPIGGGSSVSVNQKTDKANAALPTENGVEGRPQLPRVVLKPSHGSPKPCTQAAKDGVSGARPVSLIPTVKSVTAVARWRPLKLVYGHDIRLAQMPVRCSFRLLRETVGKRFPVAKSVLIKYKDNDEDLVTITSTDELRLAESSVDSLGPKDPDSGELEDSVGMLRLHVVEVSPEQEPPLPEEEEEEEKTLEIEETKIDEAVSDSSGGEPVVEAVENEVEKEASKGKNGTAADSESKEVEMDDWLFDFAQLFRTHVGIDPEAHMDLHEIGLELCSEALEEAVTSEDAQVLFDKAALKFQEVAALAYFNWGNVDMCAARKRIPIDDSASKDSMMASQLQDAYEWVREKYSQAKGKYEKAISIKPDFYEGLLALAQQQFEMAKLQWSFVFAKKEDLSKWDSSETLQLFRSAEEKMKAATEMWEKLEEQRAIAEKDPLAIKREELIKQESLKRQGKLGSGAENENTVSILNKEVSPEEAAEQAAVMRSQIHLFWGNMLFERSQIEFKLSLSGWKKNLDTAVERFKLAGASETDIATVLKNHWSNEEATKGEQEKKVEDESAGEDRPKVSEVDVA